MTDHNDPEIENGPDESPFSADLVDPSRHEQDRHDPAEVSDDALSNPEDE